MPKVGSKEFPYTQEGMADAKEYSEATGIPVSNAQERSQIYREGGEVTGPRSASAGKAEEKRYEEYKGKMKAKGKTGVGYEEYLHSQDEKWFASQPKLRKEIKRRKELARKKGIKFPDIP